MIEMLNECLHSKVVEQGTIAASNCQVPQYEYQIRCTPKSVVWEEYHCGYIGIPDNQLFVIDGKVTKLDDVSVRKLDELLNVHGGITFHKNYSEQLVIGFDTMHAFDSKETRTQESVKREIESIIDELIHYHEKAVKL